MRPTITARPTLRFSEDAKTAGIVFLVGLLVGSFFYLVFLGSGGQPNFYRRFFGPAVMAACGKGFINPPVGRVESLDLFLSGETVRFDCRRVPQRVPTTAPNYFQLNARYLMFTVGVVWRATGVSWSGLAPLFGILLGTSLAAIYGIFRLGMGRGLATLGVAILLLSPTQLNNLPHLRDYAKAPFMLGMILIMGLLATRRPQTNRVLALSALGGGVMGLGFGFRLDAIVMLVPFVAVLLLFLPGPTVRQWKLKSGAVVLFLASFCVVAAPVMASLVETHSIEHVILLGFTEPFTSELGLNPAPYDWGHFYLDEFVRTTVSWHESRGGDTEGQILGYRTPEYTDAARRHLLTIVGSFPADVVARAYVSIVGVLDMPFQAGPLNLNGGDDYHLISDVVDWRAGVLRLPVGSGLLAAFAFLVFFASRRWREYLLVLMLVIYLAGLPAIQFDQRHFFYLEFVSLWFLGVLIQHGGRRLRLVVQEREARRTLVEGLRVPRVWWTSRSKRVFTAALATIAIVALPLGALRAYQSVRVTDWVARLERAERHSLVLVPTELENGSVLLDPIELLPPRGGRRSRQLRGHYLRAELARGPKCDYLETTLTFRYSADFPRVDFSESIDVELPAEGTARLILPIYFVRTGNAIGDFVGIELPRVQRSCLLGVQEIKNPHEFPLALNWELTGDAGRFVPYQTFTRWEGGGTPRRAAVHTFPPGLPVPRLDVLTPTPRLGLDLRVQADILRFEPGGNLVVEGSVVGRHSYLLETRPRRLEGGRRLRMRGRIDRGGLTFGVVRDGMWAARLRIAEEGEFIAIVRVPDEGADTIVLANNLPFGEHYNRFQVFELGWIDRDSAGG